MLCFRTSTLANDCHTREINIDIDNDRHRVSLGKCRNIRDADPHHDGSTHRSFVCSMFRVRDVLARLLLSRMISVLSMLCFVDIIPGAEAAYSPAGTKHGEKLAVGVSPADDIRSGLDAGLQIALTFMPYLIAWIGVKCVLRIINQRTRPTWDPAYSWTLAMIAAAVWLIVRLTEEMSATTQAIILITFLAFWACFVAEMYQRLDNRAMYIVLTVLGGSLVGLLIAALTFIPRPTSAGMNVAVEYETRAVNFIPLSLSVIAGPVYSLLRWKMSRIQGPIRDQESQTTSSHGADA